MFLSFLSYTHCLGDLAPGVLDATSQFHQHRWLEEHRIVSTTYSALPASFAQDSSLLAMNFTSWMIRSWSARRTMKLQGPGVSTRMYYTHTYHVLPWIDMYIHERRWRNHGR